jgi:WD40 repeat protein/tRNA A-37 threonylcarbamoyl transferase component Bud32
MSSTSSDRAGHEQRLNDVIAAYLDAVEAGFPPERDEWLRQHPDLADELRTFLASHDHLARVGAPLRAALRSALAHDPPPLGTVRYFGDYELLEEIGRGGMGVVFKARQKSLNRIVALKMIRTAHLADPVDVQRFRHEAEAAANLDHPAIIPVHEVGTHNGQHYFSMKLLPGGSLTQRLPQLRREPREAARLLAEVARAVHAAHQQGILHRDLKPGNVLFDAQGRLYVTDFGLARYVEGDRGLTQTGQVVGTPGYMAPEQATGERKRLSPAADVYSLGAILFECLTGRPPFKAETPMGTLLQVLHHEPPRPRSLDRKVNRELETICLKCLEKEPARRYVSAQALAEDLERWLRGEPIRARRSGLVVRGVKWLRRHPAPLLLVGLGVLLAFCVLSSLFFAWAASRQQQLAVMAREEALLAEMMARQMAEEARHRSEVQRERADEILYAQRIALAQREWERNEWQRAAELLGQIQPADDNSWELRYLKRIAKLPREDAVRQIGQPGTVRAIAFSPDGKRIAGACLDQTVKVWEVDSGKELLVLRGHEGEVNAVAWTPENRRLVSGGRDGLVKVWDAESGKVLLSLRGDGGEVNAVAVSPDGKWIASGGKDAKDGGELRLWSAASGESERRLGPWDAPVRAVGFSPDFGKDPKDWPTKSGSPPPPLLAAGASDGMLRVWDLNTLREPFGPMRHDDGVEVLVFRPRSTLLATGGRDRKVRLWATTSGQQMALIEGHTDTVVGLAFSPDAWRMATTSRDETLKIRDDMGARELLTLRGVGGGVAFSPDGRRLAAVGREGAIKVWDAGEPEAKKP